MLSSYSFTISLILLRGVGIGLFGAGTGLYVLGAGTGLQLSTIMISGLYLFCFQLQEHFNEL